MLQQNLLPCYSCNVDNSDQKALATSTMQTAVDNQTVLPGNGTTLWPNLTSNASIEEKDDITLTDRFEQ